MRHQRNRHKLSRDSAHRKSLMMNLSKELIDHERIETTCAKAKAVKPEVERLITLAKRGDLHARRQALSALGDYAKIAALTRPVARALADACAISAGQELLDVAAGNGNLAVLAGEEGA